MVLKAFHMPDFLIKALQRGSKTSRLSMAAIVREGAASFLRAQADKDDDTVLHELLDNYYAEQNPEDVVADGTFS